LSDTTEEVAMREKSEKLDVRLSPAQREAIERLAAKNSRTLGAEVRAAVDRHVEAERTAAIA
jgi:hypothetical protein